VGPRAGLDVSEEIKISRASSDLNTTQHSPSHSSVAIPATLCRLLILGNIGSNYV